MTEILLLVAGFVCGVVNSVAGGGVLVVFPALLMAGVSPLSANITSNLITFPGTSSAAYASKKDLSKIPKKYFMLLIPSFLGGLIGLTLLNKTSNEIFNTIVPWLILTAVFLFAFQPQLHRHLHRPPHLRFGSPLVLVGIALFFASIYAGYFGAGFGFLMMALLGFTNIHGIFKITALKNLTAAMLGLLGTIYFSYHGGIAWKYGLIAALGSVFGGYFGAKFFHKVSPHTVRAVVSSVGIIVAIVAFINF